MKNMVTIIVPLYNCKIYIYRLLESLENQSYKNFDVVFVDDASSDGTQEVVEGWLIDKTIHYQYIYLSENVGPGEARNKAIKKISGEYVLFIDSDDWIREDALEILIKNIEESELLLFDYYRAWSNGDIKAFKDLNFNDEYINKDLYAALTNDGVTRKLFKKSIIVDHKVTFPSWYNGEDIAFVIIYTSYIKKISYISENLYYYLQRKNSISNKKVKNTEFYIELCDLYNNYHSNSKFKDYRIVQDLFYNQVLLYLKNGLPSKDIKNYLANLSEKYPGIIKRVDLNYFEKVKQIFIKTVAHKKIFNLKAMYFIKKYIVK